MNVMLDETLLERARAATDERTFSGAIRKALQEIAQRNDFIPAVREDARRRLMLSVPTKRTSVLLDEKLLEKAQKVTGERTYSGAIRMALQEIVRKHDFRQALRAFEEEAAKGGFFHPGYLEEIRPNAYSVLEKKQRVSANERRISGKKSSTLGSR